MNPPEGKNVLVTSGIGSFGRILMRWLLTGEIGQPKQVMMFSRDETKQHSTRFQCGRRPTGTEEIISKGARGRVALYVREVREYASVVAAVHRAALVLKAAAKKQVATCEYLPGEAVQTNVLGPGAVHVLNEMFAFTIARNFERGATP